MTDIHPSAIVAEAATIGPEVEIGPYCTVGPEVTLERGVALVSHVSVAGRTTVGPRSRIYPFAAIGHPPQDLKYKGEASTLEIGSDNVIREHVTMNPGTAGGGLRTVVAKHCLFMVGSHVAHDCGIGDHVVLANNATLAGHVTIEDYAIIGGLSAIHQHVRIGRHAIVGGMSGVDHDIIPYGSAMGDRAHLSGLNIVGLKRRGFSRDQIHTLRTAYRLLFAQEGNMAERVADVEELYPEAEAVKEIVAFIRSSSSSRAVCQPKMEHEP